MEAWMAFLSIMAIVAIVLVAGGLIAFIAHVIMGAFENDSKDKVAPKSQGEVIDYNQYKQLVDAKPVEETKEYDFDAINAAKAEEEQKLAEKDEDIKFDIDEDLEKIEERLKKENETKDSSIKEDGVVVNAEDDADLDDLLAEISADIIDEEKEKAQQDGSPKMSDALSAYTLEKAIKEAEDFDETEEETDETEEETDEIEDEAEEQDVEEVKESVEEAKPETNEVAEIKVENEAIADVIVEDEEDSEEDEEPEEGALEIKEDNEEVAEPVEEVEEKENEELTAANKQIEALKAQLEELNKKLEAAQTAPVEVVAINMTEAECLARMEVLEERLKNVRKDYKINLKEYKPLKKVMTDLEKYQTKLRRKETMVAKKKVALYGVNNYVDIDKDKAEKLANELELYRGLRLSVAHCEEVINANKERFPILEHTHNILEDQIAHLEADLEAAKLTLQKIREQNGNGEQGNNDSDSNSDAE